MDALSKIFADIHLNHTEYIYLKTQGEWSFICQDQTALIVHIVLVGSVFIQIDAQNSLTAHAGEIVVIPSGKAHTGADNAITKLVDAVDISKLFDGHQEEAIEFGTHSSEKNLILTVRCQIDTIMARPFIQALPPMIHLQHGDTNAPEWLQIGLHFLALETQNIQAGRDIIIDHLVNILLIKCIRDHIQQISSQHGWLSALNHPELSNSLAAIHNRPEDAWTVESLAEQCCMSRSKFASLFHEVIGESPLAYLQQHRMRLASQYLRKSNYSVQQIANKVGYSSETAFSQAFKRTFEHSPKQYRQLFVEEENQA
ncbi:AraC family transcriptional regulator [Acinetobacter sp.]|uniref:AraC family transcriptional regulator n=1 Tax=Acinetobacter sp. TaxID=472 RepID=UPI0031D66835